MNAALRSSRPPVMLQALLGVLIGTSSFAADMPADSTMINPEQIKWGAAPPFLPKGGKMAVLSGDPGKPGPFVLRSQLPANYRIPAHWHSQVENLTVLSGAFYIGFGDKFDVTKAHAIKAGGFHRVPPKTHHYAFTKGPAVLQVHGEGPLDFNYVNLEDNPHAKAEKAAKK